MGTHRAHILEIIIGLIITVCIIWIQFTSQPLVNSLVTSLENTIYDLRYKATLPMKKFKAAPIVIVDIDERSLQQIGRWPWPRNIIATLNDKLVQQGAVVVGYDVIFSEPQANVADQVLTFLRQKNQVPNDWEQSVIPQAKKYFDEDHILAESFAKGEIVLGYLLHNESGKSAGQLPAPIANADAKTMGVFAANNYTANLSGLQQAATSAGFTTVIRDQGGVVRHAPLVMQVNGKIYGSLSLELARLYLLDKDISFKTSIINGRPALDAINIGAVSVPTDEHGQVLIPFRGSRGSFPYVSAVDVLNHTAKLNLAGKIVLVGTSALGLSDLHATSVQDVYPGVEAHASVVAGILAQDFPSKPVWTAGANLFALAITGLVLALLFPFLGPVIIIAVAIVLILTAIVVNIWLWVNFGFVLAIVTQLLLIVLLVIANTAYGFLFEARKKKQITKMFGQYVSSDVVAEMSKDPTKYSFDGETRELTVLFSDIRGFTNLSETLAATELKNLLNRFFSPMTEIIFKQGGTIDKYVGDMIMAFWGAPKYDAKHANNAVIAALKMLAKTTELKPKFAHLKLPNIDIGIGINTGNMHVGDMGSSYRRSYTVLGDEVNLGSRLESLTKFYGVKLIIGENTFKQLEGIICRQLDLVQVKGKQRAVAIYEPICMQQDLTPDMQQELATYNEALSAYFTGNWAVAAKKFTELLNTSANVVLYTLYINRCVEFQHNPPAANWGGVYVRTEK